VEPLPDATVADAGSQDGAGEVAVDDIEAEVIEEAVAITQPKPAERAAAGQVRHIARDYSYVRAEVRRIAVVGGFLIVCLIIAAILRG
jgi:hypothetical protein